MAIWKQVVGYEGLYEVSNHGAVRRPLDYEVVWPATFTRAGLVLRPATSADGYLCVVLNKEGAPKGFKVHRVVAAAFIGPCPKGLEVNHKDGDKLNNVPENLEYVSHRENMHHAIGAGLFDPYEVVSKGELHWNSKLTPMAVRVIRRLRGRIKQKEIAALFGVCSATVMRAQLNQCWQEVRHSVR